MLNTRHFLGLFANFDTVSDQKRAAIEFDDWVKINNHHCPMG
jgi:hypothetical protein